MSRVQIPSAALVEFQYAFSFDSNESHLGTTDPESCGNRACAAKMLAEFWRFYCSSRTLRNWFYDAQRSRCNGGFGAVGIARCESAQNLAAMRTCAAATRWRHRQYCNNFFARWIGSWPVSKMFSFYTWWRRSLLLPWLWPSCL